MTEEEYERIVNWLGRLVNESRKLKAEITTLQNRIGEYRKCLQKPETFT